MSQVGAKGRAQAGQTYSEILTFYYTGVEFSTVDGSQPIRVRLSDSFWPTATKPARVTGYIGGWRSDTFPGISFPQGSYVQMAPNTPPPTPSPTPDACGNVPVPTSTPTPSGLPPTSWIATAYDSTGAVIASATTNDLTVTATDPEGVLRMAHRDEQVGYTTYRGSMRMVVMPTGLQTINILPVEQYLRGVVPAESPASWPIEAVKAQAVAARTYAWQRLKRTANWDVLPDSANQNYGGWQHERARSDAAIIGTANQVLTYNGAVISAVYHSASGGYTENSEYSFTNARGDPGNVVAYLRGKPDVDANGVAYDVNASSYDWQSAQFTMSQLSTIFGRNTQTDVGDIYSIDYLRGVSGRVYQVVLTGSEGTKTVSGGRFKNIYNDNKMSGAKLLSAMFYLTPVPPPASPSASP
jgi:stage II sporulation protein D